MSRPARTLPMKFSLRDLLLLTLVVALAVGWWLDRQAREARIKLLQDTLSNFRQYGVPVDYDGPGGIDEAIYSPPTGVPIPGAVPLSTATPGTAGSATFVPTPPQR